MKRVVSSWRTISIAMIARRYDSGGNHLYAQKAELRLQSGDKWNGRTMRIISLLLSAAALTHTTFSLAASDASSAECAAKSQGDMRSCLEKESAASERELAQVQKSAVSTLARWDEDLKYISEATAALKTSTQSFRRFRQAQCDLMASLGGGAIGNALALRRLACVANLNRQQSASIQQAVASLPVK